MERVIRANLNIGKASKLLQKQLNQTSDDDYTVQPFERRGSGAVVVTNNKSNKHTLLLLDYDVTESPNKCTIPWDSSYVVNHKGEVFDEYGESIGEVRVVPNSANSIKRGRNYKLTGKFNSKSSDMIQFNSSEEAIAKLKGKLSI